MVEIKNILEQKKFSSKDIDGVQFNVTKIFEPTESKIIKNALNNNGVVYAVKLPGFAGIIGKEVCPGRRLGTEISDYAKFYGGVKGIFHTDELPGYNITIDEVSKLKSYVNAGELDAVLIVADKLEKSKKALDAVVIRSKEVFNGVLLETRSANPDGSTRFTRPRPDAARMYPETDVKPIIISPENISRLKQNLPGMPEVILLKYQEKYKLNEKLARQIVDSDYINLFGEIVSLYPSLSTLLSVTLTEDLDMRLGNIYMAMLVAKIEKEKVTISSAGMPPALFYRSSNNSVEEIKLQAIPLGGPADFTCPRRETSLSKGDTLLLMSDGFPELFYKQKEILDYSRAKLLFGNIGAKFASDIIKSLLSEVEIWKGDAKQEDDITFVVVKKK